jgi:vancomycin resistance protein YoaR
VKVQDERSGWHAAKRHGRKSSGEQGGSSRWPRMSGRAVAGVVLVFCALLSVTVAADRLLAVGEIRPGVHVGAVALGGMTPEEAAQALEDHASRTLRELALGDERGVTLTGQELGVRLDVASTVEEAYAVGRGGGPLRRLSGFLSSYFGGVDVAAAVTYDREAALRALEAAAPKLRTEPEDATLYADKNGEVVVKEGREGRALDPEATLANLDRALSDLSNRVEPAETFVPPRVSAEDLEGLKPTELIGEYKTDFAYDSNPSRQTNMRLAAGAVDNTLLAPGEVFSFNELTAPLGYEEAKVFSEGGVAVADGGGLCQVSSTLYMAAQYAGLEIVERNAHYAVLPYIRPGFDATVWFGGPGVEPLDLKFENTTDGYVLIREYVDEDGFLNAEIYGRPTGREVEMRSERIFEDPQVGIKWVTYKTVKEDGKMIEDGVLHEDLYSYNPPAPEDAPSYETSEPRVAGWDDPNNTTGWADVR